MEGIIIFPLTVYVRAPSFPRLPIFELYDPTGVNNDCDDSNVAMMVLVVIIRSGSEMNHCGCRVMSRDKILLPNLGQ